MNVQRWAWASLSGALVSRKARTSCPTFLGRDDEKPGFSSSRWFSWAASCRQVDPRGAGRCSLLTSNVKRSADEVGGATAHERALDASEAWRAKRCVQAVSGGHEGRRERQASGLRHTRPAMLASRKARTSCPTFLGAGRRKAKVFIAPLLLMGGFSPRRLVNCSPCWG